MNLPGNERRPRTRAVTAEMAHQWRDLLQPIRLSGPVTGGIADGLAVPETERILFALAQAVEQRDSHTAGHCERLAFIAVAIGIFMELDRSELVTLYRGGYLHDIGKVGIPDSILFKPQALTPQEWEIMKTHTVRGADICCHLRTLTPVVPIIRHHHERWDGSGYPDGLRGEEIPLTARVMQVADIYDALTNPRPYKLAYSPDEALRAIQEETDRGWRDPSIVKVFLALHKDVISKAGEYIVGNDRSVQAMRAALLHQQLGK